MGATLKIVVIVCVLVYGAEAQEDSTMPNTKGQQMVHGVINQINNSGCFVDDCGLLEAIAEQTSYGLNPATYNDPNYHGGIWQIDEAKFDDTQDVVAHPLLTGIGSPFECILAQFGIDWTLVTWEDLRRPLYSALAARLCAFLNPEPIPKTGLEDLAEYWLGPGASQSEIDEWVRNALTCPYLNEGSGEITVQNAVIPIPTCFPPTYDFIRCLGWIESRWGTHPLTYRLGFDGGIWQVTEAMFLETQDVATYPQLQAKYDCLWDEFGIDWSVVVWFDLRRPQFSAYAAMLYLCTNAIPPIPLTPVEQCDFWVDHWVRGDPEDVIVTAARRTPEWWLHAISTKGDPHMEQLLPGSKTPLCYDIIGDEGDVYSLYTNPDMNVEVNIRLTGIRKGDKGIYIGEVILMVGNTQIQVTLGSVSFNGEPKQMWMTQNWHDENKTAEVTIEARKLVIDLTLTQIRIVKNRRWLDVEMSQTGSFGQNDGGVFGFLGNHAQIEEHNLGANLVVTNVAQNTTDVYSLHSKPHHCWRIFKKGHDDFSQFLKNHIIK